MIYGKERATGKDAQVVIDILDEINEVEDNDERMYEDLDSPKTIDKNFATSTYAKGDKAIGSTKSNKKRNINETCDIVQMANELGDRFKSSLNNLGKNFRTEAIFAPKYEILFEELSKNEGLTENEVIVASRKIVKDVGDILVFFNVPAHQKLEWIKGYLNGE
ncbi:hypothetical protein J1N35_035701 [Gossypium stocksii]|uniref:Uncharacterized protein n=1 Tax=Gossypium stocksii TaxID=47602 RepID=A0A9D3ZQB9_9ROSI|nr:hypothetical protein J1N35_035701 [Gossypium stocksii]